jgi:hypothetical protein
MKFFQVEENDFYSYGIWFGTKVLLSISWAKEKDDFWKDDDENDINYGLVKQKESSMTAHSLIFKQLKLNVVLKDKIQPDKIK